MRGLTWDVRVWRLQTVPTMKRLRWFSMIFLLHALTKSSTNEWGFRPRFCTYRLNWAGITSWWWWVKWHCLPDTTQAWEFGRPTLPLGHWGPPPPHNTKEVGGGILLFLWNLGDRPTTHELQRYRQAASAPPPPHTPHLPPPPPW